MKTVSVRIVALAAACGAARGETYFIGELSNSKTVEQESATALVIHTKMSSYSSSSSFFFFFFLTSCLGLSYAADYFPASFRAKGFVFMPARGARSACNWVHLGLLLPRVYIYVKIGLHRDRVFLLQSFSRSGIIVNVTVAAVSLMSPVALPRPVFDTQ